MEGWMSTEVGHRRLCPTATVCTAKTSLHFLPPPFLLAQSIKHNHESIITHYYDNYEHI